MTEKLGYALEVNRMMFWDKINLSKVYILTMASNLYISIYREIYRFKTCSYILGI